MPFQELSGIVPKALEFRSRDFEKRLSSDKIFVSTFFFCAFSFLLQISLILVSWQKLPPQVPFFYSLPWGEKMLAAPVWLWTLPGIEIVIVALNVFIALNFAKENKFLARSLFLTNFVVGLATLYDLVKIISLIS